MQTIGKLPAGKPGRIYNRADQTQYQERRRQEKKSNSSSGGCYSFLTTVFHPISQVHLITDYKGESYNCITEENYRYLLSSARNYALLQGVELLHHPGNSTGEGISNLYTELNDILEDIQLNIEQEDGKLSFVLWKYCEWSEYTFYWIPVRFIENIGSELRKIVIDFMHQLIKSNGLKTTNKNPDMEYMLEYLEDNLSEYDKKERKQFEKIIQSYQSGKIYRLMERIETANTDYDISAMINGYRVKNDYERQLLSLLREGLYFIGEEKPSIMSYGYDPHDDEDRDYQPVDLDRMIRIVYDVDDRITQMVMEWTNSEIQEAYDISPVTSLTLTPETDNLFSVDPYPALFGQWCDKFCELIS